MTKTVLITGGSRGIGAAVATLAAERGYDVAFSYASREDAARTVADAIERAGQKALPIKADVCDHDQVVNLFDKTTDQLNGLDAFVNNAGVINPAAPLAELEVAEIRRIIDTDLTAAILCAREAVRRMARSRGGRGGAIVNISSMASILAGAGGFVPYGAAKGGIDVLTEGLGKEVAHDGIRVNGLRPGLIDTDIQDDTGIPNRIAQLEGNIPIGRGGTPLEVAEAVLWLMSDQASYVAATSFNVSGAR
ncbi:MAG: SDR family oxidoreductase [Geminicoccaceae bacterium]